MANISITGGAGNFGRLLARELVARGHELTLFDLPRCDFGFCESWEGTRVVRGDILDEAALTEAVAEAEFVFHLAAILPPASEADPDLTFRVNVEGTQKLLAACRASSGRPPAVALASSISVYGDTAGEANPIGSDHPVAPNDVYARSKVEAEKLLVASDLPWVNLRISAIAIPEFLDPPEPWPFQPQQGIELVALSDLVRAMAALVNAPEALGRTLIIAGGPSWQVSGQDYVRRWGEIMEIPFEEMTFLDRPGWLTWYDTSESQALLGYQAVSLDDFFEQLQEAVAEALA